MRNFTKAPVGSLLDNAKKCIAAKQMDQAEFLARRVIEVEPDNVTAHHLLGVIAGQTARSDLAIESLSKAAKLSPRDHSIKIDLGRALMGAGRKREGVSTFEDAVRLRPEDEQALNNYGISLQALGCYPESIGPLQKVAIKRPDWTVARAALIYALRRVGRINDALEEARRYVNDYPESPEAHLELGNALNEIGQFGPAVQSFQRAIDFRPANAVAYNNMATALREAGLAPKAIAACRKAIELQADFPEAYLNLAVSLEDLDRHEDALEAFRQGLKLRPDFADAYNGLANVLYGCGYFDEALAHYRKALELRPGYVEAHNNLLYQLNFHPDYSPEAVYQEHKAWNEQRALPLAKFIKPHANDRNPERQLRIGYVSPNFRDHVVGLNLIPLFDHHDREKFHITCFHGSPKQDLITQEFRKRADGWHSINKLSDEEVSEMVRREKIDILVDLTLQMDGSRLLIFARKPAPVQVTFAGYPGTTGLTTIDYRLTDPYLDPPGMNDSFYSERSVRLPHSFWCYYTEGDRPPLNPLPALERGFVVFGCLNNHVKVNAEVLALWKRVMEAVPNSKLLLAAPHGEHRKRVCSQMQLEEGRVQFAGKLPREAYLETYQLIDICLDTFPYNGHTTSLDSFWMGVPVVTLCGRSAVSRAGFSQASNLGLTELVANTPDEFVRIATELAENFARLSEIRGTLRQKMLRSPLMDAVGFTRGIEWAFREMWREWCGRGKVEGRRG
jgi:predicted O-linked N-acetylglucosamine transferase (SPINDLY family)